MVGTPITCPVCGSPNGSECHKHPFGDRDAYLMVCEICGEYPISRTALTELENYPAFTRKVKAILSHRLRAANDEGQRPPMLMTYNLEELVKSKATLPNPSAQALNIIRYIGDRITDEMEPLSELSPSFHAAIGSGSREQAMRLVSELQNRGLLSAIDTSTLDGSDFFKVDLTLAGWEAYEAEQRGRSSGAFGFIALKFGDLVLDGFLADTIKPAVQTLGYELFDMRDVSQAGVIDNLLRTQIRDSAFVLVDLSHDNSGAYWEAGYAEGLGKPVLYLCERSKFQEAGTHFDTNHCTTVLWDKDDPSSFTESFVATLRRSLNLY